MPNARWPSKRPETLPNKQNVMRCLRLNRRRLAMPVTRHGRQPKSNGGEATSPNFSHKGISGHAAIPSVPNSASFAQCQVTSGTAVARCWSLKAAASCQNFRSPATHVSLTLMSAIA